MPVMQQPEPDRRNAETAVLTKATVRAADRLRLPARTLASVLGLSEPTISRMRRGEYRLGSNEKSFELAIFFVRLFRSLDSLFGGDEAVAQSWLNAENLVLGGRPIDKITTIAGLTDVIAYLDARRAIV